MNMMIKRFVDQGFLTEAEGQYLEEALERKETVIVSGHRSAGTRPFMAGMMATAKSYHSSVQVKDFDDLEEDVDFLLIPGLDGIDFEEMVKQAMKQKGKAFVTVKEPEHPYSLFKLLREVYKEDGEHDKVYHLVECKKVDDVPKLTKITEVKLNEKGRIKKTDFEG